MSSDLVRAIEKRNQRIKELEARTKTAEVRAIKYFDLLTEAVEELEDLLPYVPLYFQEKWGYQEIINRLREEVEHNEL